MIIPDNVILEVSTLCNVSCLGCALHGPKAFVKRPFGNMKKEIWEPVIKEIGDWGQNVSITAHGGGEPLLNPNLREILEFAGCFPNIKIGFLTNGMLLDESWSDFILNINLDWIAFSIDGVLPQTHDKIRKKSNLYVVEKNLQTLLDLKKKRGSALPHVKLNMVAYDDITDQQDAFVEKWIDKVECVMVSHFRNPPESKRWPNVPDKRKPCNLLWSQMVVAWDGRLGLCCEDFNIDYSPGTITESGGLLDLWNGGELSKVRELHRSERYDQHPMCRECDTWAEGYFITKMVDHKRGYCLMKSPSQTVYKR